MAPVLLTAVEFASTQGSSAANYYLHDGNPVLQITADQQPWCPEFATSKST
ncbi:MAG: hypothetical protein ACJ78Q_14390 [Chloroflexia bacterium]